MRIFWFLILFCMFLIGGAPFMMSLVVAAGVVQLVAWGFQLVIILLAFLAIGSARLTHSKVSGND